MLGVDALSSINCTLTVLSDFLRSHAIDGKWLLDYLTALVQLRRLEGLFLIMNRDDCRKKWSCLILRFVGFLFLLLPLGA
jgi:hypothetical protein